MPSPSQEIKDAILGALAADIASYDQTSLSSLSRNNQQLLQNIALDDGFVNEFSTLFKNFPEEIPMEEPPALSETQLETIKKYFHGKISYILEILLDSTGNLQSALQKTYSTAIRQYSLNLVSSVLTSKIITNWLTLQLQEKIIQKNSSMKNRVGLILNTLSKLNVHSSENFKKIAQTYQRLKAAFERLNREINLLDANASSEDIKSYSQVLANLHAQFSTEPAMALATNKESLIKQFQVVSDLNISSDVTAQPAAGSVLANYNALVNGNLKQLYENLNNPGSVLNQKTEQLHQLLESDAVTAIIDVRDISFVSPPSSRTPSPPGSPQKLISGNSAALPTTFKTNIAAATAARPLAASSHAAPASAALTMTSATDTTAAETGTRTPAASAAPEASAQTQNPLPATKQPAKPTPRWKYALRAAATIGGLALAGIGVITLIGVTHGAALPFIAAKAPWLMSVITPIVSYASTSLAAAIGISTAAGVVTAAAAATVAVAAKPSLLSRFIDGIKSVLGSKTAGTGNSILPTTATSDDGCEALLQDENTSTTEQGQLAFLSSERKPTATRIDPAAIEAMPSEADNALRSAEPASYSGITDRQTVAFVDKTQNADASSTPQDHQQRQDSTAQMLQAQPAAALTNTAAPPISTQKKVRFAETMEIASIKQPTRQDSQDSQDSKENAARLRNGP